MSYKNKSEPGTAEPPLQPPPRPHSHRHPPRASPGLTLACPACSASGRILRNEKRRRGDVSHFISILIPQPSKHLQEPFDAHSISWRQVANEETEAPKRGCTLPTANLGPNSFLLTPRPHSVCWTTSDVHSTEQTLHPHPRDSDPVGLP